MTNRTRRITSGINRVLYRLQHTWSDNAERLNPSLRAVEYGFNRRKRVFFEQMWHNAATAIGADVIPLGEDYLAIRLGSRQTIVRHSDVMLDTHLALRIAGNKPLSHRLLAAVPGYRGPRFLEFSDVEPQAAAAFMQAIDAPCVVKPAAGTGAGRGVTTQICNRARLRRAILNASRYACRLLIEEQIPGHSYRLLFLEGELIQVLRRDPPSIEADGISTIRQLLKTENRRRLCDPDCVALHPLLVDLDAKFTLSNQGYTANSKPPAGQRVQLKTIVNQNAAAQNHVIDEPIHPSISSLGSAIAQYLQIDLMGLDLICQDLSLPLEVSGGVVNEVNTTPGLHHHYLVSDPGESDVASVILNSIFARMRRAEAPQYELKGRLTAAARL